MDSGRSESFGGLDPIGVHTQWGIWIQWAFCIWMVCSRGACIHGCLYPSGSVSRGIFIPVGLYPRVSLSQWVCIQGHLYPSGSVSTGVFIPVGLYPRVSLSQWVCIHGCLYPSGSVSTGVFIPVGLYQRVSLSQWVCINGCLYPSGSVSMGVFIPVGLYLGASLSQWVWIQGHLHLQEVWVDPLGYYGYWLHSGLHFHNNIPFHTFLMVCHVTCSVFYNDCNVCHRPKRGFGLELRCSSKCQTKSSFQTMSFTYIFNQVSAVTDNPPLSSLLTGRWTHHLVLNLKQVKKLLSINGQMDLNQKALTTSNDRYHSRSVLTMRQQLWQRCRYQLDSTDVRQIIVLKCMVPLPHRMGWNPFTCGFTAAATPVWTSPFDTVGISRGYTDHHQGRGQP